MPMRTSISEMPGAVSCAQRLATRPAPASLRASLVREAVALGFDDARITTPNAIGSAGDRLIEFLEHGRHGDMAWMATTAERRRDPRALWPEVKSIVMLASRYAPARDPIAALEERNRGIVSAYAQG